VVNHGIGTRAAGGRSAAVRSGTRASRSPAPRGRRPGRAPGRGRRSPGSRRGPGSTGRPGRPALPLSQPAPCGRQMPPMWWPG